MGQGDAVKQAHEIGMVILILDSLGIAGKNFTADAVERQAHCAFIAKDHQPLLHDAIRLIFEHRGSPNFSEPPTSAQGHIEQRAIWTTTRPNDHLDFPGIGQVFAIERRLAHKKSGKTSAKTVFGLTSHFPQAADAPRLLPFDRSHWSAENGCHYVLDWNGDEDRCTLDKGHRPKNPTALGRFAIGAIKFKTKDSVASAIQRLARDVGLVFDHLSMTENSCSNFATPHGQAG